MATGNTLIDDAAEISGVPRPTIKAYVHKLREAGLIGPTGLGGAGTPVSENDAVALLAAHLARPTIGGVAEATDRVLKLRQNSVHVSRGSPAPLFWNNELPSVGPEDLERMLTFSNALHHLLLHAENFCTQDQAKRKGLTTFFGPNEMGSKIKIAYYRPVGTAFIAIKLSPINRVQIKFSSANVCNLGEDKDPEFNAIEEAGHQTITGNVIDGRTILAYARSILKRNQPP